MRVAVYCRVSTEDQAESKTIENQLDFADRYCSLHGLEVYQYYLDEGVSGTISVDNRPAGSRLLADARKGLFSAVCVYRLDRLARTALEILRTHQQLGEDNIILKSMTENFDTSTPSGKFFMTTLGGIAEIERETIAERMRLGKERALREGRWPGGKPPYGYFLSHKRLAVNPDEAAVVKDIFRMYNHDGMSAAAIADYLSGTRVPSPGQSMGKGPSLKNGWHRSRVWSILSQSAYRGVFIFKTRRGPVELKCPSLIPEHEWQIAQHVRRKNYADAKRNGKREYLLRGLIKCGQCGRKFYGDGSDKQGRHSYYRCAGSTLARTHIDRCHVKSVRADELEKVVWADIRCFLLGAGRLLEDIHNHWHFDSSHQAGRELEEIHGQIGVKKKEKKRMISLYRKQVITEEELKEEMAMVSRELDALKNRLVVLQHRAFGFNQGEDLRLHLIHRLETGSSREKRELLQGLVESIVIDLATTGVPKVTIRYFFAQWTDCVPVVETRGKYRLGLPKSTY